MPRKVPTKSMHGKYGTGGQHKAKVPKPGETEINMLDPTRSPIHRDQLRYWDQLKPSDKLPFKGR